MIVFKKIRLIAFIMASLILLSSSSCEKDPPLPEPNLEIKVWSLDGSSLSGHNAILQIGQDVQKSIIDAQGIAQLVVPNPLPRGQSVRLYIDAVNTASRTFHPSLLIEGLSDTLNITDQIKAVMVPLRFNITFGPYSGQSVEVSILDATTPGQFTPAFYDLYCIHGIPNYALPIEVGISTNGILPSDADAIWAAMQSFANYVWPPENGPLYKRVPFETPGLGINKGLRIETAIGFPNWGGGSITSPIKNNHPWIIYHNYGGNILLIAVPSTDPNNQKFQRLFPGHVHRMAIRTLGPFVFSIPWPSIVNLSRENVTSHDVTYIRMMHLAYDLVIKNEIPVKNVFYAAARGEEMFGR